MPSLTRLAREPVGLAAFGGLVYAAAVFSWLRSNGLFLATDDPVVATVGLVYGVGGLFLIGAVPLYLLVRLSLVTPAGATAWFLGDTVYQHLYGAHLHPLSSYVTVWPILFGAALVPGVAEALVRIGLDRRLGAVGLRPLT